MGYELDFKNRVFEIKFPNIGPDLPKKVLTRLGDRFPLLKNEKDQIDNEVDHDGVLVVSGGSAQWGDPIGFRLLLKERAAVLSTTRNIARGRNCFGKDEFPKHPLRRCLVGESQEKRVLRAALFNIALVFG